MDGAGWNAAWGSQNKDSEGIIAVIHDVLSAVRRLYVIDALHLLDPETTTTTRELATAIAAVENEKEPNQVTNNEYRTVYQNLRQHHLPGLADINAIEYDSDRNKVNRGKNFETFATLRAITTPLLGVGFSSPKERE